MLTCERRSFVATNRIVRHFHSFRLASLNCAIYFIFSYVTFLSLVAMTKLLIDFYFMFVMSSYEECVTELLKDYIEIGVK